jgi:hypothetical protein
VRGLASVLAFALGVSSPGHSCDDGYAIEAVLDDGNVIRAPRKILLAKSLRI